LGARLAELLQLLIDGRLESFFIFIGNLTTKRSDTSTLDHLTLCIQYYLQYRNY